MVVDCCSLFVVYWLSLVADRWALFVVGCSLLFVTYVEEFVVRDVLLAVGWLLLAVCLLVVDCCSLFPACCLLRDVRGLPFVACCCWCLLLWCRICAERCSLCVVGCLLLLVCWLLLVGGGLLVGVCYVLLAVCLLLLRIAVRRCALLFAGC